MKLWYSISKKSNILFLRPAQESNRKYYGQYSHFSPKIKLSLFLFLIFSPLKRLKWKTVLEIYTSANGSNFTKIIKEADSEVRAVNLTASTEQIRWLQWNDGSQFIGENLRYLSFQVLAVFLNKILFFKSQWLHCKIM